MVILHWRVRHRFVILYWRVRKSLVIFHWKDSNGLFRVERIDQ